MAIHTKSKYVQITLKVVQWLLIFVIIFIAVLYTQHLISNGHLPELAQVNRIKASIMLGVLMCLTTVFAPLTSIPFIPLLAPTLGPFTTGLVTYIGWVLGSCVIFYIGRKFGRPYVVQFVEEKRLRQYEKYVSERTTLLFLTALHVILPVDVLSYALASATFVPFRIYLLSTSIGILWFPFTAAYFGNALLEHDYVQISKIVILSSLILMLGWAYVRTQKRS